ncbi:uncharacterized protein EI90DRAFT_783263 [Cantharellus anzutake]|uniref:uncharacterized protein n=1 Tax=Cantharellus anzutake TaxID=1750568 RepID=UPI001902DCE9|nr:uncharacterized protein EI90DRAFT_783263 [Cantharellus anzutake]KAF8342757.1 hypothetical protein EI90DRAFT_783263 [Cantharellus anzutake]
MCGKTLLPANSQQAPILSGQLYGNEVLEGRKKLAFMGLTHKAIAYPVYQNGLRVIERPLYRDASTRLTYSQNRAPSL